LITVYSLLISVYSLLIIFYSLLIIIYSLLIIYYSLLILVDILYLLVYIFSHLKHGNRGLGVEDRNSTRPLLPYQEGPVPACQADPAPACRWRPDCPTPDLLDGDSSPGPPTSSHRGCPPHWPASTAVH